LLIAVLVLPGVMEVLQGGVKAAALFARQHGKDLVFYRTFQPSVSVYRDQIIRRQPAQPGQWVYMRVDRVDEFLAQPSPYRKEIVFSQPPATLVAIEEKGSE